MPACSDGVVEFDYAWNLKDIPIRIMRSCIDHNYCGSIIGRPKIFAHCVKKAPTPEEVADDIDKRIEEIGREEERMKAGSAESAMAKMDRLKPKWKQAFNDKWDTLRHYHELLDMYDKEPFDVREKRINPVREKTKPYSDAFDVVDGKYSKALKALRVKANQARSEYLEVNHEWKNAEGITKEQRDALKSKWQKMKKENYDPLAKLCGKYAKFRREYVEEYEKKHNYDTGELFRHKYDWH